MRPAAGAVAVSMSLLSFHMRADRGFPQHDADTEEIGAAVERLSERLLELEEHEGDAQVVGHGLQSAMHGVACSRAFQHLFRMRLPVGGLGLLHEILSPPLPRANHRPRDIHRRAEEE